jgi:hypothetical protein
MRTRCSILLIGLAALLSPAAIHAADPPAGPAYQIVLRSRHAEATPTRTKDAQTGGGFIVVEQPEPNTIVVTMGGSAVAGSDCHGSSAGIDFNLQQELDIIPTRTGLRPPRIGMVARVVGTLQVTDPGKCGKACGTAEQGPAEACLTLGDTSLLSVNVKPSSVACGQESSINHRHGPVESTAVAGSYLLTGTFHIGVSQGKGVWNRQAAVADFDPAPQLDSFWADALKPFRAVPRKDFGFKVIVRVVEEAQPEVGPKN